MLYVDGTLLCPCEQPTDFEQRCLLCVDDHLTESAVHTVPQVAPEEASSDEDYSDTRSTTNPYSSVR